MTAFRFGFVDSDKLEKEIVASLNNCEGGTLYIGIDINAWII
jgi:hypothetical protein